MSDLMEVQRRYFAVQLERAQKRPGVQQNKIADCEHYLQVLDGCAAPLDFKRYVQQHSNMLSTGKAEAKDRYTNLAVIYDKLGQQKKAEANRRRLEIIDSAATHAELAQQLEEFENKDKLTEQENKAILAASGVWKAVFGLATEPKGTAGYQREKANFATYHKLALETDPEFSWEKLVSYPPYRDRVVYTEQQLELLRPFFEEVC